VQICIISLVLKCILPLHLSAFVREGFSHAFVGGGFSHTKYHLSRILLFFYCCICFCLARLKSPYMGNLTLKEKVLL
jgi:hypothetical protein